MTGTVRIMFGTLLAVSALAGAAAPAVPLATDLHQDGIAATRRSTPLVLLFTLPNCTYCHAVRRNYLAPLMRGEGGRRYIVREIVIDGERNAIGLDGKAASHRALALRFNAPFGPTVLFVDASGKDLAAPLIGGDTAGMYGAYLDARLTAARKQLSSSVD